MKQNEGGEWKHDKVTVFNSVREVPWSLVSVPAYFSMLCQTARLYPCFFENGHCADHNRMTVAACL